MMIDKCKKCGKEELIHAKGLCHNCYNKLLPKSQKYKQSQKLRNRDYRKKNPRYWRDYQRKVRKIPKSKWRKE